jgi:hypothetical protein
VKVLFAGATFCSWPTFKRLIALADEIAFIDRPAVTFNRPREISPGRNRPSMEGSWGTVGVDSFARSLLDVFADKPVSLTVCAPPSGPVNQLYLDYITADLTNLELRRIVLEGMRTSEVFAKKFVQAEASYGECTGREVIAAIDQDETLATAQFEDFYLATRPYEIHDSLSRRETLKMIIVDVSIHLTNAMLACAEGPFVPITDDRFFESLLVMRLSDSAYVAGSSSVAPLLGLEVMRSVIPDEVLNKLSPADILDYRKEAKDAHAAWSAYIAKLATEVDDLPPAELEREIPRLIARQVTPQLVEYRHAMESARDQLFADLIKSVTSSKFPTISVGALTYLTFHQALTAFIAATGSALASAIPAVVDSIVTRRDIRRKHSLSYLVGLSDH